MRPIDIPKDELKQLYLVKRLTQKDIAQLYHCSQVTVRNYMLKYDIAIRSKSEAQSLRNENSEKRNQGRAGELNANYRHGGYIQARIYQEMVEFSVCEQCGSSGPLVVHHKNGDHFDNTRENLEVLCRSCHQSYHKQKWWDTQKAC